MSELPAGWEPTLLGDVVTLKYGKALPERLRSGAGFPVYGSNGIVGHHESALTAGETLIIGRKGSIGEVHFSRGPCNPIDTTYYVDEFYSSPAKYWYQQLRNLPLRQLNTSTAIPGLNREDVYRVKVAVPPVAEQRRIATKLDAVLAKLDACRERLVRVPPILKRFREAVLEAAVSGRLTEEWRGSAPIFRSGATIARELNARFALNSRSGRRQAVDRIREIPDVWGWSSGDEVVETGAEIVYGIVQPGPKLSKGVQYVRGMDIEDGRILVDQLMRTSEAIAKRYERASLKGGDVLLGIIRATKVAIVPEELTGANITQGTARYRPSSAILTKYLARVLEAPQTQKWLHDHYRGIDMPGLNLADVRRVPIPLPSIEEQHEIIRRTDELLTFADNLSCHHEAVSIRVERMTPSVLAKAFRGELVPQDPRDEPAGELLERVRREREVGLAKGESRSESNGRAKAKGGLPKVPRRLGA